MTTIEIILAVAFVTYILFSGFAIFVMREVIIRQKAKMKHYKSAKYQREKSKTLPRPEWFRSN